MNTVKIVKQQESNKETVMRWNETCSDCYWFDASESECTYAYHNRNGERVRVNPDHSKCSHFSG